MYEEIFNQIRSAANKRNLKDSTIHAYCTSVAHFLNRTAKDIDALTTDDVDIFLTEKKLSGGNLSVLSILNFLCFFVFVDGITISNKYV